MMVDSRAFPGIAQSQTGLASAAQSTLAVTLPTPPAGQRQYLTMIVVTLGTGGGNTNGATLILSGVEIGGGSAPICELGTSANGTSYYPLVFAHDWPAAALASAINVTLNSFAATFGATVRCTLWGYNVPE